MTCPPHRVTSRRVIVVGVVAVVVMVVVAARAGVGTIFVFCSFFLFFFFWSLACASERHVQDQHRRLQAFSTTLNRNVLSSFRRVDRSQLGDKPGEDIPRRTKTRSRCHTQSSGNEFKQIKLQVLDFLRNVFVLLLLSPRLLR